MRCVELVLSLSSFCFQLFWGDTGQLHSTPEENAGQFRPACGFDYPCPLLTIYQALELAASGVS